jgi:hypothetical protein
MPWLVVGLDHLHDAGDRRRMTADEFAAAFTPRKKESAALTTPRPRSR